MILKTLTWLANLLLASLLIVLSVEMPLHAQALDSADNSGSKAVKVPLSGTAIMQSVEGLSVSPTVFNANLVDIGSTQTASVLLSHDGAFNDAPIVINEVDIFGVNADEFSTPFIGFVTLNPGESLWVNLEFSPSYPGTKSAGMRLNIEGSSVPHVLLINGSARYPLSSDLEPVNPAQDFGQVVTDKATNQTVKVSNTAVESDAPVINVISASLSGDTPDAFTVNFQPASLVPGASMNINVEMQSSIAGFKSAYLNIQHDGNNGPVEVLLEGEVKEPGAVPVNFGISTLNNITMTRGTAIAFGPDDKLYVTQMTGVINIYDVVRNGANNYSGTLLESIDLIKNVQNHDDDGTPNNTLNERLVTGILVTGTANNPIIYSQSSDPRQGGGSSGADKNLDTNSGILHRLTKNGGTWEMVDLVRGLPRSEENHHGNGMVMMGDKLLMSLGGHTNMGASSNNFAETPEFALSAAILEFDLNAIGNGTYDLPTLDDEDRVGVIDQNDPFGGNNGKNMAILEANGPVKIYAPGFRNAYHLVLTESGRLYTVDNGPNAGWGGLIPGDCTIDRADGGSTYQDALHYISGRGYYGGHPNPIRGNKNNTLNDSNPQSPIEGPDNPIECDYKIPLVEDGALTLFNKSTNGFDEYTASNFSGAMQGDLIIATFAKEIYRIQLNAAGNDVISKSVLASPVGSAPLGLVAQGDSEPFPGTIWIASYSMNKITIMEPSDY